MRQSTKEKRVATSTTNLHVQDIEAEASFLWKDVSPNKVVLRFFTESGGSDVSIFTTIEEVLPVLKNLVAELQAESIRLAVKEIGEKLD